jgi:hypothetical protein
MNGGHHHSNPKVKTCGLFEDEMQLIELLNQFQQR